MKREYDIKPIPKLYNGIMYKSSLEATWAAFFDFYNIDYIYEPAKFNILDIGFDYTPDFFIPKDIDNFFLPIFGWSGGYSNDVICIEVKPTIPTRLEITKALNLLDFYNNPKNAYSYFRSKTAPNNETSYEFVFCIGSPFERKCLTFTTESDIINNPDLNYYEYTDDVFSKIESLKNLTLKNGKNYPGFYFHYRGKIIYCNEIESIFDNLIRILPIEFGIFDDKTEKRLVLQELENKHEDTELPF